jgi:hypothetical protein
MKVLPPPYSKKIKKSFDSTWNRIYLLQHETKNHQEKNQEKNPIRKESSKARISFLV